MLPLVRLRAAVREALAYVSAQPDVAEAEVFVSANTNLTVRLNYTSHIPCNGVEEPESVESYGLGIRAAFRTPEGIKTGLGSEPSDLSTEGAARALDKARRGAVLDPEFVALPAPVELGPTPARSRYHDPALARLSNSRLLAHGWNMLEKGLDVFQSSEELRDVLQQAQDERSEGTAIAGEVPGEPADLELMLGGDLVLLRERMAIASTLMPRVQSDESTPDNVFCHGDGGGAERQGQRLVGEQSPGDFTGESAAAAARRAIASMNGQRVPSGSYRVVLGPQPLAELLEWVLLPGLQLDTSTPRRPPLWACWDSK